MAPTQQDRIRVYNRETFAATRAKFGEHLDAAHTYLDRLEEIVKSGEGAEILALGPQRLEFEHAIAPEGIPTFIKRLRQAFAENSERVRQEDAAEERLKRELQEAVAAEKAQKEARRAEFQRLKALKEEFGSETVTSADE